ncbi:MAG TPA: hypothetical protein PK637_14245 [Flavobacteriales bacterium]|nr:hypothetical protein [Flavobacteriales bacterium]
MIDELKKSIAATLYERNSSPFYGTFIFSWLIWNWKIPYVTLFINADDLSNNKMDYIANEINLCHAVLLPLASTLVFIGLMPFITNEAYRITLGFRKKRKEYKQKIENEQLLSKEESFAIRQEILNTEQKFDELLKSKNNEIEQLKGIIQNNSINKNNNGYENENEKEEFTQIINNILTSPPTIEDYRALLRWIQQGYTMGSPDAPNQDIVSYLESAGIITKNDKDIYNFTAKGERFKNKIGERLIQNRK